jgi:hypothetical protein
VLAWPHCQLRRVNSQIRVQQEVSCDKLDPEGDDLGRNLKHHQLALFSPGRHTWMSSLPLICRTPPFDLIFIFILVIPRVS